MSDVIAEMEDAILAALSALKVGESSGYLRTVRGYGGDIGDALKKLALIPPALLIRFAGTTSVHRGGIKETRARWALTAIDNAAYGEKSRRRGAPETLAHPGSYAILNDARAILEDLTLVEGAASLALAGERPLAVEGSLSAMEQTWETTFFEERG